MTAVLGDTAGMKLVIPAMMSGIFSMQRDCSGIDKRCSQMKEETRNTLTSLQSMQEQRPVSWRPTTIK